MKKEKSMTNEEMKKSINEIAGTLTKNNLLYALSIFKALQQGESAIREELKEAPSPQSTHQTAI